MKTEQRNVLAVEATPRTARLALCDGEHNLIEWLETGIDEEARIRLWLRELLSDPIIRVLGNPLDHWPRSLEAVFTGSGLSMEWLSPIVAREAQMHSRFWDARRRLHRCRRTAYLARHGAEVGTGTLVSRWEFRAACEATELTRGRH